MHPTYLGWQVDWPVFIKLPVSANGKNWKRGEHFNWLEQGIDQDKVATSTNEYNIKKCKKSKIDDKQRGLIRRFLNNSAWITEDFYAIRDKILND